MNNPSVIDNPSVFTYNLSVKLNDNPGLLLSGATGDGNFTFTNIQNNSVNKIDKFNLTLGNAQYTEKDDVYFPNYPLEYSPNGNGDVAIIYESGILPDPSHFAFQIVNDTIKIYNSPDGNQIILIGEGSVTYTLNTAPPTSIPESSSSNVFLLLLFCFLCFTFKKTLKRVF